METTEQKLQELDRIMKESSNPHKLALLGLATIAGHKVTQKRALSVEELSKVEVDMIVDILESIAESGKNPFNLMEEVKWVVRCWLAGYMAGKGWKTEQTPPDVITRQA